MRVVFSLLFFVLLPGVSDAWTPKTYQLIVVQSVKLMPKSFRTVMLRHKEEILMGCLKPDERPESDHLYDPHTKSGYLQDQIMKLSEEIPKKIYTHVPFRIIAQDFGRLAHYMADLNDPLLLGNADSREPTYAQDFAIYAEKNIDQFPWIFDGHEDPLLKPGTESQYFFRIASESVKRYPLLGEAFYPNGTLVSADTFDWRSLPFGIASLSYSHSISNTVQIWFYIWKKSHGDTTITPLYSNKKPRSNR